MSRLERATLGRIAKIDRNALSDEERIYSVRLTERKQDPQIIRAEISLRNLEST